MLDYNARRPAFDAFFRSLDDATRTVFLDTAMAQWQGLQDDDPSRNVSLLDCMENVWDLWRGLTTSAVHAHGADERAIMLAMRDTERLARYREYLELAGLTVVSRKR